jgi:hypothetical protein
MSPVSGVCMICGEAWSGMASGPLSYPHVGFCCWLQWSEPAWKTERLARDVLMLARIAEKEDKPNKARKLKRQLKTLLAILKDREKHP